MIITKEIAYKNKYLKYDELKNTSMIKLEIECDCCYTRFISTKYQIVRNGHQLCKSCAIKSKESKQLEIGKKYGFYTIIGKGEKSNYSLCKCECGKEKYVKNYTLLKGLSKSCGCKKLNIRYKELNIGETFGRLTIIDVGKNNGYSLCECECGNIVEVRNTSLSEGRKLSCGCLQKEIAHINSINLNRQQKRENHPNWKGGTTEYRKCDMATSKYKDFRKSVFERDDYICQKCKCNSNKLNVHHIFSYATNKDLRYSVNNGITLCKKCHNNFHKLYGKVNDDKQLNEFLGE